MFENVLIGIDGRQGGRDATALARQLACAGARFTLLHVYGAGLMRGRGAAMLLADEARRSAALLEREREATGLDAVTFGVADHSIGRALRDRAALLGADLIAVGATSHHAVGRYTLGDDAAAALDGAKCPVAVAPPGHALSTTGLHVIGVGYDASPESVRALALARELAAHAGATVRAIGIVPAARIPYDLPLTDEVVEHPRRLIERARARLQELDGVEPEVGYGVAGEELAALSRDLDLLIVGASSRDRVRRRLHASTTEHLVRHAACPLLVLPRVAERSAAAEPAERVPDRAVR